MNKIFFIALFLAVPFLLNAQDTRWAFDKAHSEVKFIVSHMVIADVTGRFNDFDGTIITKGDNFENAKIDFTVRVKSINTDNEKRDEHLRSDDFFNAEKFPTMTFKSKSMKKSGKNKYKLVGDLTIRDVTKQVTLDVEYRGMVNDPWGNTKAGFRIKGKINRFDFGLKWNNLLEGGGLIVGKDVEILCNIELNKQKV